MTDRLDQAVELFEELCNLSPEEQDRRLARLGAADPELRAEVEEILLGDRTPDERLDRQAQDFLSWETELLLGSDEPISAAILERLSRRGRALEHYRQEAEIGRGGMGAVYEIWDEDLERTLAMKIHGGGGAGAIGGVGGSASQRKLRRFLDEARITGQLDHPGIVPVHDLGIDSQGRAYFTMKHVQGRTLREVFRLVARGEEGWTQTRALGVLLRICEAMSYAHAKGVVHRDLKPANIMVGRFGEVFVMDWGVAWLRSRSHARDVRPRKPVPGSAPNGEIRIDSPVVTMDGAVIGTPHYMSPEQARGGLVDERSDVYAIGAMLYTLLSGSPPYGPESSAVTPYEVLEQVVEGPPQPASRSARGAAPIPAELEAICQKAMARTVGKRYASMADLADDLRAYLEGRVVSAHRTGALAELRKWTGRNRALALSIATGIVVLVVGLVASLLLADAAAEGREAALLSEATARQERTRALRLSIMTMQDFLREQARELWPAHPALLEAYDRWLEEVADSVAFYPEAVSELAALRELARPRSDEERQAERRGHPDYRELQRLEAQLATVRRAQAVARGEVEPVDLVLEEPSPSTDASVLNDRAWELVKPDRAIFGREAEGVALARLALEHVTDDEELTNVSDTLAWALFAIGLHDEALEKSALALESAAPDRRERVLTGSTELEQAIAEAREGTRLETLQDRAAELEARVSQRSLWAFASADDQWWHDILSRFVASFESVSHPETGLISGISAEHGWGIERRKAWAERVEESTISGASAREAWEQAMSSIADEAECPAYAGLRVAPQIGLLPLGRDPVSGLWEFAHLQSGAAPTRGKDGDWRVTPETGLVLVLLPGGTFSMGAQAAHPDRANHDPAARPSEGPVHTVELSPFFLSKYELTQSQWVRMRGTNPSFYAPGYPRLELTPTHPVERVSWFDCAETARWFGLALPTEAQWEYAARANRDTPWWTGREGAGLEGHANLADNSARRISAPWGGLEDLDDDYPVHAPVDAHRPNPFGLFGMNGNVFEWCRDEYAADFYLHSEARDPFNTPQGTANRVSRGGSFRRASSSARSAFRQTDAPDAANSEVGLRPARRLDSH